MADQLARAAKAWPTLTRVAQEQGRIQYGHLAAEIDIHVRPLRNVLGVIQSYCLIEGLPPLTILAVDKRGKQGKGFIAWDPADAEAGFREVWDHPWGADNPFRVAGALTEKDLLTKLKTNAAEEVWQLVASRGVRQLLFRRAVREAYAGRCAVSGCSIAEALEAAHIVPWSACKPADRLSPRNGLLLTSFHHRLFDRGVLTIDRRYRVRVLRKRPRRVYEVDRAMLWDLDGKRLSLPRRTAFWPDLKLIEQRNVTLEFADGAG